MAAIPAAGAEWVNECAATTGQTGSWSEGFAYDPATQTADICGDAVFTPNTVSAGNFVTLKFTTTLYRQLKDDAPDADTQGALCIGTNGCFQVWTSLRQGKETVGLMFPLLALRPYRERNTAYLSCLTMRAVSIRYR